MERPIFVSDVRGCIIAPLLGIVAGIVCLVFQEYVGMVICFGFTLLCGVIVFIFRKHFFKKMLIAEQGVYEYYRNNIVREIEWGEIKEAHHIFIFYLCLSKGSQIKRSAWRIPKQKDIVSIWLRHPKLFSAIVEHKYKIPVPIKDIETLPKHYRNSLKITVNSQENQTEEN